MLLDKTKLARKAMDDYEKLKAIFKAAVFDLLFHKYPQVEVTVYYSYQASFITVDIGFGAKVTVPFGTSMASTFESNVTTNVASQNIVNGYSHILNNVIENVTI